MRKTLTTFLTATFLCASGAVVAEPSPWNAKANSAWNRGDQQAVASMCGKLSWANMDTPHSDPQVYVEVVLLCAHKKTPGAASALSQYYFWQERTVENGQASFVWGLQAAKQGDKFGMLTTCRNYIYGVGTAIDHEKAKEWCNKIISKGDSATAREAQLCLDDIEAVREAQRETEIERRNWIAEQAGRAQQRIFEGKPLY